MANNGDYRAFFVDFKLKAWGILSDLGTRRLKLVEFARNRICWASQLIKPRMYRIFINNRLLPKI